MEGKLDVVFDVGTSQFNLRQFLSRISSSSPVRNELKDHILRLMFEESDEDKPVIVSQEMSKFQFLVMVFNLFNSKHVSSYNIHSPLYPSINLSSGLCYNCVGKLPH